MLLRTTLAFLIWIALSSDAFPAERRLVADAGQLQEAIATAKPGDVIAMRSGTWRDVEILFEANGREGAPIVLEAEAVGKTVISGRSNLSLAGEYLHVRGLVFKDGHSPTGAVISFRKDSKTLATHSRVSEVVIDRFNKPDRLESDLWVSLFGSHNRFDHNHLVGKMNQGVTLAVRLDTEESRKNQHRIDHNYFGPRPVYGSNGGETLRIGTSHYSLSDSMTVVESNVFEACDGEVEIISVKSGKNVIRNNLFLESAGTLTLRHGEGNQIEGNAFLGKGKAHTGGIRVINADHRIRNNYLEGLTGTRFGGGFVVMNGVPNSPLNRYNPVENVEIRNNTLVDVDHIELAAGSDQERSVVPDDTRVSGNLFVATRDGSMQITTHDDISGIEFKNNGVSGFVPTVDVGAVPVKTSREAGWVRDRRGKLGADPARVVSLDEVGVSWYPKGDQRPALGSGKTLEVSPAYRALEDALGAAAAGDTLVLEAGEYTVERVLEIAVPITIVGAGRDRTTIQFTRNALFEIQDGGSLSIGRLTIDGSQSDDSAGNAVVRTNRFGMLNNYRLIVDGVAVRHLDVNHSFNFLNGAKSTLADEILVRDSEFSNITGDVFSLDNDRDDLGRFNVDYLVIDNVSMSAVEGRIASVYRGGTDESTFGPHLTISNSRFDAVGTGARNPERLALSTLGVQMMSLHDNVFTGSGDISIRGIVGEPLYEFSGNDWGGKPPHVLYKGDAVEVPNRAEP